MINNRDKSVVGDETQSIMASGDPDGVEVLVAELANEFLERIDDGDAPSIDDFVQRAPEHADLIRRTLESLRTLRNVGLDATADQATSAAMGTTSPRELGDFRILEELGRGGMGVVYEAEQVSLGRRIALKVLPFATMLDEQSLQRFRNEIVAAAQLDHPHIVSIYGSGCDRGVHHYAMQLIRGLDLATIIDDFKARLGRDLEVPDSLDALSRLQVPRETELSSQNQSPASLENHERPATKETSSTRANLDVSTRKSKRTRPSPAHYRSLASLFAQVAEALEHAHERGVIHRDVKPSNILVDERAHGWITDFGLARIEANSNLTFTGDILGTAKYMSPEQVAGKQSMIDHRTDIYSLGITLYEALTYRVPHLADDRETLFRKIAHYPPARPTKEAPSVPRDLETIVLRAIEKDPADRYPTAAAMAEDLRRFASGGAIVSRRPSPGQRVTRWIRRRPLASLNIAGALIAG